MNLTIFIQSRLLLIFLLLSLINSTLCAQWKWINPLPTGNDLKGVSFVNDSTGWTIGNKGSIFKTTDFGKSWSHQTSGLTVYLNDICMVNKNTGYAVGDSSAILKTTDGGSTWQHLDADLSSMYDFVSVYFLDELRGWIGGNWTSLNGMIISTKDGGITWSEYDFWWADWVGDIQFVDSLTGYRAGRFVKKTTDGGKSWIDLYPPVVYTYNDLFFTNKDTGWVVCGNELVQTKDGGTTWTVQSNIESTRQIFFSDTKTGWSVLFSDSISKTTDGGITWSKFNIQSCSDICITPTKGYAVGMNGVIAKLSSPASNNWTRMDKNFTGKINLTDVYFNDPLLGFAVGDSGKVFRTKDGGFTWDCIKVNPSGTLNRVVFTDANSGWIVSDNAIYHSSDGGDTWQISRSSNSYFKDIFFRDAETGWAVSLSDYILNSNNRGYSWNNQYYSNQGLYGVAFTSFENGWIVGEAGNTLHTTDGGAEWNKVTLPSTKDFLDIEFYNENIGWIAGSPGTIMKTENNGGLWTIQNFAQNPSNYWYKKLSVIDSSNVWLAGVSGYNGGLTVNTKDGGANWMKIENDCYQQLNSIFFCDANKGFAVGNGGTILQYTGQSNIPLYPSNLLAEAQSESKIKLTWQDNSTNEDGFEILRSDNNSGNYKRIKIVGASTTSCVDSVLALGTDYWYRVRAYNSNGKSAWTREDSATTFGTRAPEAPLLVSPANFSTDLPISLTLTWNTAKRATSYHLQLDDDYDFRSPVYDESGLTVTSQQVTDLDNNKYYYWRVNATNAGGTGPWSEDWVFKTLNSGLDVPVLSSPEDYANDQPTTLLLSWNNSAGAESYTLQVDDNNDFSSPVFAKSGITSLSQAVTGLNLSTFYHWRVKSVNSIGSSDWSYYWSFTTTGSTPDAPVLSWPENMYIFYNADVMLQWNSSDRAKTYRLQVDNNIDFSSPVFDTSGIQYANEWPYNLDSSTVYYWRVNATNASGTSDWSEIWNFTTVSPTYSDKYKDAGNNYIINYPNPFCNKTIFEYSVSLPGKVVLSIFNLNGEVIKILVNEEQSKGEYFIEWDGSDQNNRQVPDGFYLYKLQTNRFFIIRRLCRIR